MNSCFLNLFKKIKERKEIIWTEIVIFFVSFMFCIFAPFEIYLASKNDFFFEGYEMISFFALCFGALFCGLSIINFFCMLISSKAHNFFFGLILSLGVAFYIQGNYIIVDYGVLDGNVINWNDYKIEGIVSHGTFILLLIIGLLLLKKLEIRKYMKLGSGIAICIVLVQCVTLLTLWFQVGGLDKEEVYVSTTKNEFTYSEQENMFVLLLDTFDARVMNEILLSEDAEDCKQILTDFTYFPNTIAKYSNTYFSIPQILSGVEVEEDMLYADFIEKAYDISEKPFYKQLKDMNWNCRMYSDIQMPEATDEVIFDNINKYTLSVSSHRRLGEYMVKLIGFRYMPQCMKKYFWFYSDDMKDMIDIESDTEDIFYWGNTEFYEGIDSINTENEAGVFAFYHLEGTHLPFYTTRDLVKTKTEVGINEEGLAMMNMLDKFCSKLKELEIYDNSIIVVMADHGHYEYHQNPVFMVKGFGERHEFAQSDICFTYENIQQTWYNLISGASSQEAVVPDVDGIRVFYEVDKEELSEMIITDDVSDAEYTGKRLYAE